ncbi:MAG TPA: ankyrin repeat domain-containing protein [Alphaproteobacteria bacterium]|nr:ankyrin repeat domain-containing protein [Alphaproteobacteria bacterium]
MTAALKTKAADGLKKAFRDALARSPKVKAQERKRLDKAAQEGNLFVMKEIIARYPNEAVNWQDPEGSGLSPLHFAAIGRRGDIAEWLLTQGADTTLQDKDGLTALHYAAQAIDPDALYKLLNVGADIEARNNKGETPLMFAVVRKTQPDNIGVLVLADADIHAADNDGETPIGYARKNRMRDIANTIDWAFGTRIAHKAAEEEAAQAQKDAAIADAVQTMTSGSTGTVAIKKPLRLKNQALKN